MADSENLIWIFMADNNYHVTHHPLMGTKQRFYFVYKKPWYMYWTLEVISMVTAMVEKYNNAGENERGRIMQLWYNGKMEVKVIW